MIVAIERVWRKVTDEGTTSSGFATFEMIVPMGTIYRTDVWADGVGVSSSSVFVPHSGIDPATEAAPSDPVLAERERCATLAARTADDPMPNDADVMSPRALWASACGCVMAGIRGQS